VSCLFSTFDHAEGAGWLWVLDFSKIGIFMMAFSTLLCALLYLAFPLFRPPARFIVKMARRVHGFITVDVPAWIERY
jgi:hypothetical protein